jgi:CRISPR system Cascade subunit CasA
MEVHYNLLDEPWIPCVLPDGTFQMYNLRDCLLHAHEIREIHAELPPMTASLLMLLLAVLYRSLTLKTEDDWIDCWEAEKFDPEIINNYLNQWHTRFDLFDEKHPFYQDPLIGKRPKDIKNLKGNSITEKNVSGLILHSSNGDAGTLFDHTTDDNPQSFPADQIARYLIMFQAFSLGGMSSASISVDKYYKDAPHGRGVVIFLQGISLFHTLMVNLLPSEELQESSDINKGIPAWEQDDPLSEERNLPDGILDFLTWQSRRLLLIPDNNNGRLQVQTLYAAPGHSLTEEFFNPFYSYKISISGNGKQERKLLRFSENRALWRDSLNLMEQSSILYNSPTTLGFAYQLIDDGIIEDNIHLLTYGQCSEPGKKKGYFYREENFSYPSIYLHKEEIRQELERQLFTANEVKSKLWGALNQMAGLILAPESDQKDGRNADPKDKNNLVNHWDSEALYWKSLEIPFYRLINQLPLDQDHAITEWQHTLRKTAIQALEQTISFTGTDTKAMKAASQAKRQLLGGIRKVLIPETQEEK